MSSPKPLEDKVLDILLSNAGSYISGAEIASALGVSRMAVSKAVNNLKKKGHVIRSHPRLGYCYVDADDLLYLEEYLRDLSTRLRYRVVYFEEATSTQDIARSLANTGVEEGTIVIAEKQSCGRGRLGRDWISPPGGLWFTVILRPPIPPPKITLLSLLTGCAVALGIMDITGLNPRLKWPNDVLLDEKKTAGILVEAVIETDLIKYAFVGIGVNVNNEIPREIADIATSVSQELGRRVSRVALMRAILKRLDELYTKLVYGYVDHIIKVWKSLSSTLGKRVVVYLSEKDKVEGLAIDVDSEGLLIVKTDEGKLVKIYFGDIIHLRHKTYSG